MENVNIKLPAFNKIFLVIIVCLNLSANQLEKQLESLKTFSTLEADFTQEKQISILNDKIILTGKVKIKKPNKLLWHTQSPIFQKIIVDNENVSIIDDIEINKYSLKTTPFMKEFLSVFINLINNDLKALENNFNFKIKGTTPLEIILIPKQKFIAENIKKIILKIINFQIKEITMIDSSDDYLKITFNNIKLDQDISNSFFKIKGN